MKLTALLFLVCVTTLPATAEGQTQTPGEVYVRSWKSGDEKVPHQILRMQLTPDSNEYTSEIVSYSGKRYLLNVVHNPLKSVKGEHWKVELRPIRKSVNNGEAVLGDDLLLRESPEPGGDYIPRENFAAYLYPYEGGAVVNVAGTPYVEGFPFYEITSTRRFAVEGFQLSIRVESYKRSSVDVNKLDFINVSFEFQDSYVSYVREYRRCCINEGE